MPTFKYSGVVRFCVENARCSVLWTAGFGLVAGLLSAAGLAVITQALADTSRWHTALAAAFIVILVGKIASGALADVLLARFVQATIYALSLDMAAQILRSSYRAVEQRGSARIHATLTDDVHAISQAAHCLPSLIINTALLAGGAAYLAWLSRAMFLVLSALGVLGAVAFAAVHRKSSLDLREARQARSVLFECFRTLTEGLKELLMNGKRREQFLDEEMQGAADAHRIRNIAAARRYTVAEAWADGVIQMLIAAVLFAVPLFLPTSAQERTGYVLAVLYMSTPLWMIVSQLPVLARGNVALEKIEELAAFLRINDHTSQASQACAQRGPIQLTFNEVTFRYGGDAHREHRFAFGPANFTLATGEVVFVIGGNGSGKSTFVKLLAGLYAPEGGEIRIAGHPVSDPCTAGYRELFSVVFADCFIFARLPDIHSPLSRSRAEHYLHLLDLHRDVAIEGDRFSTTLLSQGQRKRLALLTAYMEDRPFYVFDEWAAEQDPAFKQLFYSKLLTDLRDRGKGVVVVTHDDRYFHVADRIVRLDDGQLLEQPASGQSSVQPRSHVAWH
jgi:putative pyoverdin transport system ATP-binding/permease protein